MNKETKFLIDVAKQASKLITKDIQVKAKDDKGDLVTNFDLEIETFINNKIKEKYPNFDIISEEYNFDNKLTDNCFTVDPIDGTINFAHGLPLWAIQIACIKNKKSCAAVIYAPKLGELYYADDKKAYLNNKEIRVNNLPIDKNLYVVEGRNRLPSMMRLNKHSQHGRVIYCVALDYAWVASGVLGGAMFRKNTLWDYIPGQHIVRMAGGYITNRDGGHAAANTKEFVNLLDKQASYFDDDEAIVKQPK